MLVRPRSLLPPGGYVVELHPGRDLILKSAQGLTLQPSGCLTLQGRGLSAGAIHHLLPTLDTGKGHRHFWLSQLGMSAPGIQWPEARDATKHPSVHGAAPTADNYLVPRVRCAELEEPTTGTEMSRHNRKHVCSQGTSWKGSHPFCKHLPSSYDVSRTVRGAWGRMIAGE